MSIDCAGCVKMVALLLETDLLLLYWYVATDHLEKILPMMGLSANKDK